MANEHRRNGRQPMDRSAAWDARAAVRHLRRADGRWDALIRRVGPYAPPITCDPFAALIGSIVHQQVSMSAGVAIFGRVKKACSRGRLSPNGLLGVPVDALRAAGLSRQKVEYVQSIARAFATREVTAAKLRAMGDEQVEEAVTRIKGVGRWTAQMLLIFCLHRPDVWPAHDLGLRKAVQLFDGSSEMPSPAQTEALGEPWRPYRTAATWYLWKSLEKKTEPAVVH